MATLVAAVTTPAIGQRSAPPGWKWTLDSTAQHVSQTDVVPAGSFGFVTMAPGWHVTMGPGGLLYHPRNAVEGRFSVESRQFLFPGSGTAEYGVFVGGRDLEGASPGWVALVVRRDRSTAVLRRANGRTEILAPWTVNDAVKGGPDGGANVLRVSVDSAVVFRVNDVTIATFPRGQVSTDGIIGLRAGRDLNLHITTLDLSQRLAPVP